MFKDATAEIKRCIYDR